MYIEKLEKLLLRRHLQAFDILYCPVILCRGNLGYLIDLRTGQSMTKGESSYFSRSEEVWFWPVA